MCTEMEEMADTVFPVNVHVKKKTAYLTAPLTHFYPKSLSPCQNEHHLECTLPQPYLRLVDNSASFLSLKRSLSAKPGLPLM